MASMKEKAQCVLWYHETKSLVTVQQEFRNEYGRPPPDLKSIRAWYSKFVETVIVGDLNRSGRPRHVGEHVERNYQLDVLHATKGAHFEVY